MDHRAPPQQSSSPSGRIPLAVVVMDGDGLVSHWSSGARRLFGTAREEAVGRPVVDSLPVSGALAAQEEGSDPEDGPDLDASIIGRTSYPTAGRANLSDARGGPVDVLWWAYPLVGPGPERLVRGCTRSWPTRTCPCAG
jgi:hypothetical protein